MPLLPLLRYCVCYAALASTCCLADDTDLYTIAPPPSWVIEQAVPAVPANSTEPLDLLLDDSQINMTGVHTVYMHRAMHTENASGTDRASEIRLLFNPDFQSLTLHQIKLIRGTETRDLLPKARIRMLRREESLESGIHDNEMTADIILDDIRAGDTIDYSYTVAGFNPIFLDRQFGRVILDNFSPIERLTTRVITNANTPLTTRIVNGNATITQARKGNFLEYSVERNQVPALPSEDNIPNWAPPYSMFEYSQYKNWEDVQKWASRIYDKIPADSAAVLEQARQLRAGSNSDAEFIAHSLAFVQNEIRYVGLELGENSHLPHAPDEVLKERLGDCKDKSLLLVHLLRDGGIKAYPAMVSAESARSINDDVPSPASFDHVIARVDLGDHRYWLDSTLRYQTGPLDTLGKDDYGFALVVGGQHAGLEQQYRQPPMSYNADVVSHFRATDFNGPVLLDVTTTFRGHPAEWERYRFKSMPEKDIEKSFTGFMEYYFPDIRALTPPRLKDDPANNQVELSEHYEIPHYWDLGRDQLRARIVLRAFMHELTYPRQVKRQFPFALPSPRVMTSTTYFHFPMDVHLFHGAPDAVENQSFQGVRFHGRDHYQDNTYIHRASLVITGDAVAPADMVSYARFVKSLSQQTDYTLLLPTPDTLDVADIEALKAGLKASLGSRR